MARKQTTPKPLFSVKGDFVESLDHFCHKSLFLLQACETALQLKQVGEAIRPSLEKAVTEFKAAMVTDESGGDDA